MQKLIITATVLFIFWQIFLRPTRALSFFERVSDQPRAERGHFADIE